MNYKLSTTNLTSYVDNCQILFCFRTLEPYVRFTYEEPWIKYPNLFLWSTELRLIEISASVVVLEELLRDYSIRMRNIGLSFVGNTIFLNSIKLVFENGVKNVTIFKICNIKLEEATKGPFFFFPMAQQP